MKELIIARHAKSSWKNTEISDIERPLNKRGYTDANTIGRYLNSCQAKPGLIFTSPAVRAFSTATIYARYLNFNFENFKVVDTLYSGSFEHLVEMVQNLDNKINVVMIFGHNPTFTDLANYFIFDKIDNIPTSGIVSIHFDNADWSEVGEKSGVLNYFHYPKK